MSDHDAALSESLAAMTRFLIGEQPLEDTLTRVAEMATKAVPPAQYAGMTLMERGRPQTTVATSLEAVEIDQAQYEADHGPCLDAFRQGRVFIVESTRDDDHYPAFSRACVEHGILSTLSVPLKIGAETNGALNLYASVERAFGDEQIRATALFGEQAAVVLTNATAYWAAFTRAQQLETAMETRGVIEQAKGIIMASMRCSADEAFQLLVRQSQQQNVKLNVVADGIVRATTRGTQVPARES
jgi:GAF domain-containing protein